MYKIYESQLRNCVKLEGGLGGLRKNRTVRKKESQDAKSPENQDGKGHYDSTHPKALIMYLLYCIPGNVLVLV